MTGDPKKKHYLIGEDVLEIEESELKNYAQYNPVEVGLVSTDGGKNYNYVRKENLEGYLKKHPGAVMKFTEPASSRPIDAKQRIKTVPENISGASSEYQKQLQKKNFVQRFNQPDKFIKNADGTTSTHKMASAEVDGKQIAFPTIVEKNGKLVELSIDDAIDFALKNNEYAEFAKPEEAQAWAEGGYKKGTPLEEKSEPKTVFKINPGTLPLSAVAQKPVDAVKKVPLAVAAEEERLKQMRQNLGMLGSEKIDYSMDRYVEGSYEAAKDQYESLRTYFETDRRNPRFKSNEEYQKALRDSYRNMKRMEGMKDGKFPLPDFNNENHQKFVDYYLGAGQNEANLQKGGSYRAWGESMKIFQGDKFIPDSYLNEWRATKDYGTTLNEYEMWLKENSGSPNFSSQKAEWQTKLKDSESKLKAEQKKSNLETQKQINDLTIQIAGLKQMKQQGKVPAMMDVDGMLADAEEKRRVLANTQQLVRLVEAGKFDAVESALETQNVPGKTAEERLANYFAAMLYAQQQHEDRYTHDGTSILDAIGAGFNFAFDPTKETEAYSSLVQELKALAPIVMLRRTPVNDTDNAIQVFGKTFIQEFIPASNLKITTAQQVANKTQAVLQYLSADIENPEQGQVMKDIASPYADFSAKDWANMAATTTAIMGDMVLASPLTGAVMKYTKLGRFINRSAETGRMMQLSQAEKLKYGNVFLETIGNTKFGRGFTRAAFSGIREGVNFEVAGNIFDTQEDELNFWSGFFGGVISSPLNQVVDKVGKDALMKQMGRLFGSESVAAQQMIYNFGSMISESAKIGGRGVAEIAEEFGNEIGNIYRDSDTWNEFKGLVTERFGDRSDNFHFAVSTFVMGVGMGLGNSIGQISMAKSKMFYSQLDDEEKAMFSELVSEMSAEVNEAAGVAEEEVVGDAEGETPEAAPATPTPAAAPAAMATPEDIERRRQEELDTNADADYAAIAADYLFTGGRDVILSTDYLLQALVGSFSYAGKKIADIRKKYSSQIGNLSEDRNTDTYNAMMQEIRAAIGETYNNAEVDAIFESILNNATGFNNREGNAVSMRLEELNAQHEKAINERYDAELDALNQQNVTPEGAPAADVVVDTPVPAATPAAEATPEPEVVPESPRDIVGFAEPLGEVNDAFDSDGVRVVTDRGKMTINTNEDGDVVVENISPKKRDQNSFEELLDKIVDRAIESGKKITIDPSVATTVLQQETLALALEATGFVANEDGIYTRDSKPKPKAEGFVNPEGDSFNYEDGRLVVRNSHGVEYLPARAKRKIIDNKAGILEYARANNMIPEGMSEEEFVGNKVGKSLEEKKADIEINSLIGLKNMYNRMSRAGKQMDVGVNMLKRINEQAKKHGIEVMSAMGGNVRLQKDGKVVALRNVSRESSGKEKHRRMLLSMAQEGGMGTYGKAIAYFLAGGKLNAKGAELAGEEELYQAQKRGIVARRSERENAVDNVAQFDFGDDVSAREQEQMVKDLQDVVNSFETKEQMWDYLEDFYRRNAEDPNARDEDAPDYQDEMNPQEDAPPSQELPGDGEYGEGGEAAPFSRASKKKFQPLEKLKKLVEIISKTGLAMDIIYDQDAFDAKWAEVGDSGKKPDGMVIDGVVYINPAIVKTDTLVHEFGHLWQQWAKQASPALYRRAMRGIRASQYFRDVRNDPNYAHLTTEEQIMDEAMARAIGDAGARLEDFSTREKFVRWLRNLFRYVAETMGIDPIFFENADRMTIDQLADAIARGLTGDITSLLDGEDYTPSGQMVSMSISGDNVEGKRMMADVVNGFYSPLEKIIGETKAEKLPVKQWIEKFAKGEEAKWTGLTEWLNQQQGSVSKADIQQYLKDNRIEIVEVEKGGFDDGDIASWWNDEGGANEEVDFYDLSENEKRQARERYSDEVGDWGGTETKFSQYQVEGQKENYKEVLVTMPSKVPNYTPITVLPSGYDITFDSRNNTYAVIEENQTSGKSITGRYHNTQEDAVKNAIEVINSQRKNVITGKAFDNQFKSSHFDEPNILVHLRMNTRTDADGNKVLFLEEVQSDWGQEGKKKGFANDENQKEWNRLEKERTELWKEVNEKYSGQIVPPGLQQKINEVVKKQQAIYEAQSTPRAPFVTDTNAWTKLGLKVALKEAVKQGADKIAWSTGTQQFDRWGSEKIDWVKTPTENYEIRKDSLSGEWIVTIDAMGVNGKNKAALRIGFPTEKEAKDYVNKGSWQIAINEQVGGTAFEGINIDEKALSERGIAIISKEDLRAAFAKNLKRERNDAEIDKLTDRIWNRMQTEDSGTSLPRKEGMEEFYGNPKDMERAKDFTVKKEGDVFAVKDEKGKTIRTFKQENEANKFKENYGLGIVGNVAKSLFKQKVGTTTIDSQNLQKQTKDFPDLKSSLAFEKELQEKGRMAISTVNADGTYTIEWKEKVPSAQNSVDITPEVRQQVQQGLPLMSRSSDGNQDLFGDADETQAGKRRRKFDRTMEFFGQSDILKNLIRRNRSFYNVESNEDALDKARGYIERNGLVESYDKVTGLPADYPRLDEVSVQTVRFILIDTYSEALAEAIEQGDADLANDLTAKLSNLVETAVKQATLLGRESQRLSIWKQMNPLAVAYKFQDLINQHNRRIADAQGIDQDALNQMAEGLRKAALEIADLKQKLADQLDKNDKLRNAVDRLSRERASDTATPAAPTQGGRPGSKTKRKNRVDPEQDAEGKKRINDAVARLQNRKGTNQRNLPFSASITGWSTEDIQDLGDIALGFAKRGFYSARSIAEEVYNTYVEYVGFAGTVEEVMEALDQTGEWKAEQEKQLAKKYKASATGLMKEIKEIVKDFYANDRLQNMKESLKDRFMAELGLSEADADVLANLIDADINEKAKKAAEQIIKRNVGTNTLPSNGNKKTTMIDHLVDTLLASEHTDDTEFYVNTLMAYYGANQLTPSETQQLVNLARNVRAQEVGSIFYSVAVKAMAEFMVKHTPDSYSFFDAYIELYYAGILSGYTTSVLNVSSVAVNEATMFIQDFTNISGHINRMRNRSNNSPLGLALMPAFFIRAAGAWSGIIEAGSRFRDVMAFGSSYSKYIEHIAGTKGLGVRELEKKKYKAGRFRGRLNPWNLFKYSPRNLEAQDTFMRTMIESRYFAEMVRRKMITEGGDMAKVGKLFDIIKGKDLDMAAIDAQVDAEAKKFKAISGQDLTTNQRRIRKNEIIRQKKAQQIGLTQDEVAEVVRGADIAVFTGKRNGALGRLATDIGQMIGYSKLTKIITLPWIPFVNVVGNVFEYMVDFTPYYGFARAYGYSFTGLAARWEASYRHKKGAWSYKELAEGSAQTAKAGELAHEKQMGRAWFGTVAFTLLAWLFMPGEDDKDPTDNPYRIRGGNDPKNEDDPPYTIWINGVPYKYLNNPNLAIPLSLIGNWSDRSFANARLEEEDKKSRLALAMLAAGDEWTVAMNMSFLDGVQDLFDVAADVTEYRAEKPGVSLREEPGMSYAGKKILEKYLGVATAPLPQNIALVNQIEQIFDPTIYTRKTVEDVLMYSAGLERFEFSGVQETLDTFGEPVTNLPGEKFTAIGHYVGMKGDDPRWQFLMKYGAVPEKAKNVPLEIDDQIRTFTGKEWWAVTKLAGADYSEWVSRKVDDIGWQEVESSKYVERYSRKVTGLQDESFDAYGDAYKSARKEIARAIKNGTFDELYKSLKNPEQ